LTHNKKKYGKCLCEAFSEKIKKKYF